MPDIKFADMVIRLVASIVLGALIGLERETHGRPAGLRTHILVCFGSTLYTLCSYQIAGRMYDPARVTAQIVTGIGFLGAGTIIRQGNVVRGLTTAASVWTIAAIGVAVGIGGNMLLLALVASMLVFITLSVIPHLEKRFIAPREERLLTVTTAAGEGVICRVLEMFTRHGARIQVLGTEESPEGRSTTLRVQLKVQPGFDEEALGTEFASSKDVISYSWE